MNRLTKFVSYRVKFLNAANVKIELAPLLLKNKSMLEYTRRLLEKQVLRKQEIHILWNKKTKQEQSIFLKKGDILLACYPPESSEFQTFKVKIFQIREIEEHVRSPTIWVAPVLYQSNTKINEHKKK